MKKKFINGKIYIEKGYFVEAMYVDDNIITKIGSNEEIIKLDGDLHDFEGKTVIPGMNDSHMHLFITGNSLSQLQLYGATSIDEIIERGKQYVKNMSPDEKFIYGRGWNQDYFTFGEKRLLNRHDLDKISTEIPIICERVCVHVTSCNTKALELLNYDKDIEIEGGQVYKDENGELLGIFTENAAIKSRSIVPEDSKEDIEKKFLLAADYAIKNGLTSVQSCDIFMANNWDPMYSAIRNIYTNKKTKLRYYPQFNFNKLDTLKDYLDKYYDLDIYDEYYQKGAIKLFKDGALGARTALLNVPYNDDNSTCGVESISNEYMDKICDIANKYGVRVITHAIGLEAINRVISSYEKVFHNGKNILRHGIVHCQITDNETLKRVSDLNINVMFQPIFLEYDITMVEDRVGMQLAKTSYAHNTLYNKLNCHTAYGTDSPVENLNPFIGIYSAVTRQRKNGFPERGFYPEERVTVCDAIDCYSIESAYCEGNENVKGRIKPSYLADFVVLKQDIFTIPHNEIKDIAVEETFIGGESVYKSN